MVKFIEFMAGGIKYTACSSSVVISKSWFYRWFYYVKIVNTEITISEDEYEKIRLLLLSL